MDYTAYLQSYSQRSAKIQSQHDLNTKQQSTRVRAKVESVMRVRFVLLQFNQFHAYLSGEPLLTSQKIFFVQENKTMTRHNKTL